MKVDQSNRSAKAEGPERADKKEAKERARADEGEDFASLLAKKRKKGGERAPADASERPAGEAGAGRLGEGEGKPVDGNRALGEGSSALGEGRADLPQQKVEEGLAQVDHREHRREQHSELRRGESLQGRQRLEEHAAERSEQRVRQDRDEQTQRRALGREPTTSQDGAGAGAYKNAASPGARGRAVDGAAAAVEVGGVEAPGAGAPAAEATGGGSGVDEAQARRLEVAQLADKMVEAAHVGQDGKGRRIVMLDLQVPGRGGVRVRLRRRGDSYEVRMRADNPELARDLRRERATLHERAGARGVEFSSIEVVD